MSDSAYLAIGWRRQVRAQPTVLTDDLDRKLRAAAPYTDDGRGTGMRPAGSVRLLAADQ